MTLQHVDLTIAQSYQNLMKVGSMVLLPLWLLGGYK